MDLAKTKSTNRSTKKSTKTKSDNSLKLKVNRNSDSNNEKLKREKYSTHTIQTVLKDLRSCATRCLTNVRNTFDNLTQSKNQFICWTIMSSYKMIDQIENNFFQFCKSNLKNHYYVHYYDFD